MVNMESDHLGLNLNGEDFAVFASNKGYQAVDAVNMFGIRKIVRPNNSNYIEKVYFSHNPSGGFEETSKLYIGDTGLNLVKIGRNISVPEGFTRQENEKIGLYLDDRDPTEVDGGMSYSLDYLKGNFDLGVASGLRVVFNEDGYFEYLSAHIHYGGSVGGPSFSSGQLEEHFKTTKSPFVENNVLRGEYQGGVIVEDGGEFFLIYLINIDGTSSHKIILNKKRAGTKQISEELGLRNLLRDIYQSAPGVKSQSHGDDWRYANFAQLMGVQVVPIDSPDEIAEFENKGFGKLVSDIAKQV